MGEDSVGLLLCNVLGGLEATEPHLLCSPVEGPQKPGAESP